MYWSDSGIQVLGDGQCRGTHASKKSWNFKLYAGGRNLPPHLATCSNSYSLPAHPSSLHCLTTWNYQNYECLSNQISCESTLCTLFVVVTVFICNTLTGWSQINRLMMHTLVSHKLWIINMFPLEKWFESYGINEYSDVQKTLIFNRFQASSCLPFLQGCVLLMLFLDLC